MLTLSFVISQQLNAYLLRYSIPGYYLRTRLVIFDLSKLPMFTQLLVSFEIFNFAISDNGKRDSFRAAMILGHATTIFETPLRSDSIALHRPMRSLLKQSGHF